MNGLTLTRICEVFAPQSRGSSRGRNGTGTLIAPDLVLTACHVVERAAGDACEVRFIEDQEGWPEVRLGSWLPTTVEVRWEKSDLALLRLGHRGDRERAGTHVRPLFGRLARLGTADCEAVGFPSAQVKVLADGRRRRDTEHVIGTINAGSGALTGRLTLEPRDAPRDPDRWRGLSGAAVFCGGAIIGVVTEAPGEWTRRLDVIPISSIAEDARFTELVTGDPGQAVTLQTYPVQLATPLKHLFDSVIRDYRQLFAGRAAELGELRAALRADGDGYVVVTAPAGLGKTALAAELAASTPAAGYHFFTGSVPESTQELTFVRNLLQQLADWHGSAGAVPESLPEAKASYFALASRPLPQEQVFVVDGLDEVAGWDLAPYLLRALPAGLNVVLTVRDVGQDWRSEYRLAPEARHFALSGLTLEGALDIFRSAGLAAQRFADDDAAVGTIQRVAVYGDRPDLGLDPMYIRFLAEDAEAGDLDIAELAKWPSGLSAYLDRWWAAIKASAVDQGTQDLIGTLTAAVGPILRSELVAIKPSLGEGWASDHFEEILRPVRRFVIGNDQVGYWITHDRLRSYLLEQINVAPYRRDLLGYCGSWRKHEGRYALRHYGEHLVVAGDTDDVFALARDGAFAEAQRRRCPEDPRLPAQTSELALALAADADDAAGMAEFALRKAHGVAASRNALSPLAAVRELSVAAAWAFADLHFPEGTGLWRLLIAWELKDSGRSEEAAATLRHVSLSDLTPLWDEAFVPIFVAVRPIEPELCTQLQARLLSPVAQTAAASAYADAGDTAAAVQTALAIESNEHRAEALATAALAQARAGDLASNECFVAAVAAAQGIEDSETRAAVLTTVASSQLEAGDVAGARQTYAAATEAIQADESGLGRALLGLSLMAEQAERGDAAGVLELARQLDEDPEDPFSESELEHWLELLARKQAGDLAGVLAIAKGFEDAKDKAEALVTGAELQASRRESAGARETYADARASARAIGDTGQRVALLAAIAEGQAQSGDVAGARATHAEAVQDLQRIESAEPDTEAVVALATALVAIGVTDSDIDSAAARESYAAARDTALQIKDEERRVELMVALAEAQSRTGDPAASGTYSAALEQAQGINDEKHRFEALRAIARTQALFGDVVAAKDTNAVALESAREIDDEKRRAEVLALLARGQTEAGDSVGGRDTYAAAISDTLLAAKDPRWPADVRAALAEAHARAGAGAAARHVAGAIEDPSRRGETLARVAEVQAQASDAAEATRTALALEDSERRDETLATIADVQVRRGNIVAARNTAQRIDSTSLRAKVLAAIALAQAAAGDTASGIETARTIEVSSERAAALAAVARTQARTGDLAGARESAAEAREEAEAIKETDVLTAIAQAQAEAGDAEGARKSASLMKSKAAESGHGLWNRIKKFFTGEESEWVLVLAAVAGAQAAAGDTAGARESYTAAFEAADRIENTGRRAKALMRLVEAQARAGDVPAARDTAAAIEEARSKENALAAIAEAQARFGDAAAARETTQSIKNASRRDAALAAVAEARASVGDATAARDTALAIEDSSRRAEALAAIAAAQAQAGDTAAARKTAEAIEWAPRQAEALAAIGAAQTKAGDDDARATFAEAFAMARAAVAEEAQSDVLRTVAVAQVRAGFATDALEILSAGFAQPRMLRDLAFALADVGDTKGLKRVIMACSEYEELAPVVCECLCLAYPEQAATLAERVLPMLETSLETT